jgi:hypothetical protein
MSWPAPSRADHQQFCDNEGWSPVRNARGGTGSHHENYELLLSDGRILRTRISHPPDRQTYGVSVWHHILREQLCVTEAEFWACVKDGVRPQRGVAEAPKEAVPAEIVYLLVNRVGLPETEVARLGKDEAIVRLNQYWAESGSSRDQAGGPDTGG